MYWTSTASEPPTSYLQSNTMDKTRQTQQRTLVEAVSTCWTRAANWQYRSYKPPHGFLPLEGPQGDFPKSPQGTPPELDKLG